MAKLNIKKNDTVLVIAGRERGKTGKVLRVLADSGKLLVERVNMVKRNQKGTGPKRPGGIVEKEAPLDISNVMLVCPKTNKPTRVGRKRLDSGKTVRVSRVSGEAIDRA
jgi:large subunit ribosomal protein L24